MYKNVYDFGNQYLTKMELSEANAHHEAGKGKIVELGKMDELENRVSRAVEQYRKKCETLKTSDNPIYKVEGAEEYFTAQYQVELEYEVEQAQAEYKSFVDGMKDAAMRDLANKTRYIAESERKAAADIVAEAVTSIKFDNGDAALNTLIDSVPYMNESRKLALLQHVDKLADAAQGRYNHKELTSNVKRLYSALNDVREGDLFAVNVAKSLPDSVDGAFRRLRLTHGSYSHHRNNMHNPQRKDSF